MPGNPVMPGSPVMPIEESEDSEGETAPFERCRAMSALPGTISLVQTRYDVGGEADDDESPTVLAVGPGSDPSDRRTSMPAVFDSEKAVLSVLKCARGKVRSRRVFRLLPFATAEAPRATCGPGGTSRCWPHATPKTDVGQMLSLPPPFILYITCAILYAVL